jgi:hypothetical protein
VHTAPVPAPDLVPDPSDDQADPAALAVHEPHGSDGVGSDRSPSDHAGDRVDVVTFRISGRRGFVALLVFAVGAWVVINGLSVLLSVLVGRGMPEFDALTLAVSAAVYALTFAGLYTVLARRRPAWVRTSPRGLEMAASRCDPVSLPWSAVEQTCLRWPAPFTSLVVTPTGPDEARIERHGGRRPRTMVRDGRPSFVIDVGLMQPGPDELQAELDRRLAAYR